jgi:hypothetical protein
VNGAFSPRTLYDELFARGYARLYVEHVMQAHLGADLDFLVGRGARAHRAGSILFSSSLDDPCAGRVIAALGGKLRGDNRRSVAEERRHRAHQGRLLTRDRRLVADEARHVNPNRRHVDGKRRVVDGNGRHVDDDRRLVAG